MKIAVIGGVGSGKSTVLAMLKEHGETVVDCDALYREVKKNPLYKKDLEREYGDVFTDGAIDNKKVSAHVLGDKAAVEKLNSLAHPYIKKELDKRTEGKDRVFVEVQVFEGGLLEDYFDKVWLIVGDKQTRVNRVVIRDDSENCRKRSSRNSENSVETAFADRNHGRERNLPFLFSVTSNGCQKRGHGL